MKLIIIFIMFLFLGAFFIISSENLALKDRENIEKFSDLYYAWLDSLFDNGRDFTGYVVNSRWLPEMG